MTPQTDLSQLENIAQLIKEHGKALDRIFNEIKKFEENLSEVVEYQESFVRSLKIFSDIKEDVMKAQTALKEEIPTLAKKIRDEYQNAIKPLKTTTDGLQAILGQILTLTASLGTSSEEINSIETKLAALTKQIETYIALSHSQKTSILEQKMDQYRERIENISNFLNKQIAEKELELNKKETILSNILDKVSILFKEQTISDSQTKEKEHKNTTLKEPAQTQTPKEPAPKKTAKKTTTTPQSSKTVKKSGSKKK